MKTENPEHVGKHAFEVAGLGLAPFRYVGMSENVINYPDGSSKAGGCCDYCASGIRFEFHIMSADGKAAKVGCDCIAKVADEGLLKAYKSSPEYRAKERAKRAVKAAAVFKELSALIAVKAGVLAAMLAVEAATAEDVPAADGIR